MWASGKKVVAAVGGGEVGGFASRVLVVFAVAKTIILSQQTWTPVEFNQEIYDVLNEFDPVTNYRFTAAEAGVYAFSASVQITGLSAGNDLEIRLNHNGNVPGPENLVGQAPASGNGSDYATLSQDYALAAGDFVTIEAWHNSPSVQLLASPSGLSIHRIA